MVHTCTKTALKSQVWEGSIKLEVNFHLLFTLGFPYIAHCLPLEIYAVNISFFKLLKKRFSKGRGSATYHAHDLLAPNSQKSKLSNDPTPKKAAY